MRFIDIRTTKVWFIASIHFYKLFLFLFLYYVIQNNTRWLLVIVLHLVNRLVRDRSDITKYTTSFWGQYRVFVIAIEKCKYGILKIRIMRFVVFHWYLYAWLIFFVQYAIQNYKGWLLLIFQHQISRQVRYCEVLLLLLDFYHRLFMLLIILFSLFKNLHHKNMEKQYLVIILLYQEQSSEP